METDPVVAMLASIEDDLNQVRIKLQKTIVLDKGLSIPLYRLICELDSGGLQCQAIRAKRGRVTVKH